MNGWLFALIAFAVVAVLLWSAIDFMRDTLLFIAPEETAKRRLQRKLGEGAAYDEAVAKIDARKPQSLIALSLAGLSGMVGTVWILFF